jgi:SAM-dependent methyltransferase
MQSVPNKLRSLGGGVLSWSFSTAKRIPVLSSLGRRLRDGYLKPQADQKEATIAVQTAVLPGVSAPASSSLSGPGASSGSSPSNEDKPEVDYHLGEMQAGVSINESLGEADDYEARVKGEIEAYRKWYEKMGTPDGLHYTCPPCWDLVEKYCDQKIEEVTGVKDGFHGYVASRIKNHPDSEIHVLTLGAGTMGIEIDWISRRYQVTKAVWHGLDINGELLENGKREAAKDGIRVHPIVQDINRLDLKAEKYHYIIAHASLHHFVELEHIFNECRNHLLPGGEFIVLDICTRNEYYMWEESLDFLNAVFAILPSKFKFNHTLYDKPTYEPSYVNRSFLGGGFECIRSEEIIPLLDHCFQRKHYVPFLSIGRRLFDHMFGYNFDLNNSLDLSTINFILNLDDYMIETGKLKPETFFGVYV